MPMGLHYIAETPTFWQKTTGIIYLPIKSNVYKVKEIVLLFWYHFQYISTIKIVHSVYKFMIASNSQSIQILQHACTPT